MKLLSKDEIDMALLDHGVMQSLLEFQDTNDFDEETIRILHIMARSSYLAGRYDQEIAHINGDEPI